jgi:hypothetical protein
VTYIATVPEDREMAPAGAMDDAGGAEESQAT